MEQYRITWYAEVEDGSVLEGRSLIKAENPEDAVKELILRKSQEYRLKPQMIFIQSIVQFNHGESESSSLT